MHTRSESSSPAQLLDINCSVLDSLALEYLSREELIEDVSQERCETATSRIAAFAAYQQLHQGNVCNAMAIVSHYCPDILKDQRLQFRLKRQQFVELLRQSTTAGDAAALACARDELAPLALDAYPEAYLDFKQALLMLVQQQQHKEWSLEARHKLAELLHQTILQHLGVRSPQLSNLLIYLSHVFSLHSSGSHGSSRSGSGGQVQQLLQAPGADLVKSLLLEGRQEGPLPPEISGRGNIERDVQALMAAVSIPRQAALDALKAAAGDAAAALAAELLRFKLNVKQVDALVWDYAAARGLVEPSGAPTAAAAAAAVTDDPTAAAPSDMDIDHAPAAAAAGAAAAAAGAAAAADDTALPITAAGSSSNTSQTQKRSNRSSSCTPSDVPSPSPFTSNAGSGGLQSASCSAAAVGGPTAAAMLRSDSQSPPYKVPRWRCKQTASRFSGQAPQSAGAGDAAPSGVMDAGLNKQMGLLHVMVHSAGTTSSAAAAAAAASCGLSHQQHLPQQSAGAAALGHDSQSSAAAEQLVEATRAEQQHQRWQQLQQSLKSQAAAGSSGSSAARQQEVKGLLLQLQGLAKEGRWGEVEEVVEELQPGLLQGNHALLFDLKRCQFMQLVQANQLPAALQLARSELTPLADKHPELLPTLKTSMALLLPGPFGASSSSAGKGQHNASGGSCPTAAEDPSSTLLQQLLPLLQAKFGVEPPTLVKLLRVLVTVHKAWFRVQRCQDPFAESLGLDKLLQVEAPAAGAASSPGSTARAAGAGPLGTADATAAAPEGGGLQNEELLDYEDEDTSGFDEAEVLQVMEVLELPRATALDLLAEHGGDAQAVIMQVFGM